MGIHDGHRRRLRERFLQHGLSPFDDLGALELILTYALPRCDVNPLAHELINRFGSLSRVMDAPTDELMKTEGISLVAAALIKLFPEVGQRYMTQRSGFDEIILSSSDAGRFLVPRFFGEQDETVFVLCLDAKRKLLHCERISRGSVNAAAVSVRSVVQVALVYKATNVILAHNHTSGIALPSEDDEKTTLTIRAALAAVGIELVDHIIVADDDFVSLADNGLFK